MITLSYPSTAPTETITLPNPQLGDTETFEYGNVIAFSRTMELMNNVNADQPKLKTRVWTIRKLTLAQRNELEAFLTISSGNEILVDHYDGVTQFTAIVTNDDLEFITIRDNCNYSVTLQLAEVS